MKFEINNDLSRVSFSWHNKFHYYMSMLIASLAPLSAFDGMSQIMIGLRGFIVSYGLFFIWEVGDGFKPWSSDYRILWNLPMWVNWLRKELLYSNKFSLEDIFIWNLGGSAVGSLIAFIISYWS